MKMKRYLITIEKVYMTTGINCVNGGIISSKARILYSSGGIDARARFSAAGRNAHAQLYHVFLRKHGIII